VEDNKIYNRSEHPVFCLNLCNRNSHQFDEGGSFFKVYGTRHPCLVLELVDAPKKVFRRIGFVAGFSFKVSFFDKEELPSPFKGVDYQEITLI
jgi:hypothetical protein